jgi:hypothetical protein
LSNSCSCFWSFLATPLVSFSVNWDIVDKYKCIRRQKDLTKAKTHINLGEIWYKDNVFPLTFIKQKKKMS